MPLSDFLGLIDFAQRPPTTLPPPGPAVKHEPTLQGVEVHAVDGTSSPALRAPRPRAAVGGATSGAVSGSRPRAIS